MILTFAQLTILKTDIVADPAFALIPMTPDGAFEIAAVYNLNAVPDFWVWRTSITESECVNTTSVDATTWSWPQYIARSQAERDGWTALFRTGVVSPAQPNVRQAVADIFSGAGAAPVAQRTHLLTISRRKATRAEKLFASGTGSMAAPATMGPEGILSYTDVQTARSLP